MPPLTLTQRNLLKLVKSMHSSGQSDDCQTSVIMRHKEQPKNKEPSTPDLLNDSGNVKAVVEGKSRPRSCVNPSAVSYDVCPNNSRIELENRRWSGVQLGSKLMQAFDRLQFDDSDDYTDSLENNKPAPKNTGIEGVLKVIGRGFMCGHFDRWMSFTFWLPFSWICVVFCFYFQVIFVGERFGFICLH